MPSEAKNLSEAKNKLSEGACGSEHSSPIVPERGEQQNSRKFPTLKHSKTPLLQQNYIFTPFQYPYKYI